jgi:carbon-monoxide dehydrogenase medium subunit
MRPFTYQAPTTLERATELIEALGQKARPLAGGTDLLVQIRHGLVDPSVVVDLKRIPELAELAYNPGTGLTVGAAVTCARLCADPAVHEHYPGLVDAASIIGGPAIRERATLGGNLCNAAPSGDTIPALMVLGATCLIAGPDGARTMPVETFCTAPGQNALKAGELLVALKLPAPQPRAGARYLRFIPRGEMDIAVAGAGAWLQLDEDHTRIAQARIALAAVAPTPLLAVDAGASLCGQPLTETAFAQAAQLAQDAARPIGDARGTAAQRHHLVGVLVKRALRGASQRAKGAKRDD